MARLTVTEVHKHLGANHVLRGTSFTLGQGEIVALLGPSGSGKTTLLRAVAGLDHPDAGRIVLDDEVLYDGVAGTVVPAAKRNLGLVFQSYALWPHKTVFENVAYGLTLRKIPKKEIADRVAAVLGQIGLTGLADRHPHQLSGGQRQRVMIARALMMNPKVLLADEATSMLDASLRVSALNVLQDLRDRLGLTVLFITHDIGQACYLADEVIVMENGLVVERGITDDVIFNPQNEYTKRLLADVPDLKGSLKKRND